MNATFEDILTKAKELSDEERLLLIDSLSSQFDGFATADIALAWKEELRGRAHAVRNGSLPAITLAQSKARSGKLLHD